MYFLLFSCQFVQTFYTKWKTHKVQKLQKCSRLIVILNIIHFARTHRHPHIHTQFLGVRFLQETQISQAEHTNRKRKRHTKTPHRQRVPQSALTTKCFTPHSLIYVHTHRFYNTHTDTLWASQLLNTLPTWQPIALLVKSFPIGCTRIWFHFKEPAGSRAAHHRRENITLLFREREWGDDRQKRWMDIDRGSESAGKGGSVVISLSNITLLSLPCSL